MLFFTFIRKDLISSSESSSFPASSFSLLFSIVTGLFGGSLFNTSSKCSFQIIRISFSLVIMLPSSSLNTLIPSLNFALIFLVLLYNVPCSL